MRMADSRGFTLIELLIVVAIIGTLSAIAMAGYRIGRVRANEGAAVRALHAINQAQILFSQTCGDQRYASTLASLAIPAPSTGEGFLSPDLAAGDPNVIPGPPVAKSGYLITMMGTPITEGEAKTCSGVTPVSDYQVTADPIQPGTSGNAFFGTNTDKVIYTDAATFTGNMPATGAPGHGAEVR
jgi:prepilin-type N-terminal cleavage/methylation domain-containing protein